MTSHSSYSSPTNSRRSHMSHHHPQPIAWSLPTTIQGPPSALYAQYFGYPPQNPHMGYSSRGYPPRTSNYPAPMPHQPHPHRPRRGSTGEGPRVFQGNINPPSPHYVHPHPSPPHQPRSSYGRHVTKSILKNSNSNSGERLAPPPPPHTVRAPRERRISFSMKNFLGGSSKRSSAPVHAPVSMPPRRVVRFDLPENNESGRRR